MTAGRPEAAGAAPGVLATDDGVRLAARWWHPSAPLGEAVVVVHGFCGSKDEREVERLAVRLAAGGRRVLAFDLRGHGGSTGICTLGLLEGLDVDAAVRAARCEDDRVLVVGASLGGVAVVDHLAGPRPDLRLAGDRADATVLVATPARWQIPRSLRGFLSVALTQTPPGRAAVGRWMGTRVAVRPPRGDPPAELIGAVACPVAVVHGLADRFLPAAAARTLFAAAPGPRRLDLVPGMGHGLCAAAVGPIEAALAWAAAGVPGPAAPPPNAAPLPGSP